MPRTAKPVAQQGEQDLTPEKSEPMRGIGAAELFTAATIVVPGTAAATDPIHAYQPR